jgi:hypothetical protein
MRAKTINEFAGYLKDENYPIDTMKDDFLKAIKKIDLSRKEKKDMWRKVQSEWYKNRILNRDDLLITIRRMNENIGGAGGAGYAVYGGGWGRSFGNPSMGGRFGGRGFGFGNSMNLSGGPNLMYTYDVKPLNQTLQPPPTTQDDEELIHTGSKIRGHVLNTGEDIEGSIIHIEEDEDNNIKWYMVLDDEGIKRKVDPTSAYIVKSEEFIDPFIMDLVGDADTRPDESFYPNLEDELNEAQTYIEFDIDPRELKDIDPIFKTVSFAKILEGLQRLHPSLWTQGKLDLDKFYRHLQSMGYNRSIDQMKRDLTLAAPHLGIVNSLRLTRDDRNELMYQQRLIHGDYNLEDFHKAEIPAEQAVDSDYVVRSMYGDTEPAYYRFDHRLIPHEINQMKAAYAERYGDPEKSIWKNYLDARPATLGHIKKHGKSVEWTRQGGDFEGDVYENFYPELL